MIRSAPSSLAASTAMRPTAPSPTTATVFPGPASAAPAPNHPVPSTSEAASSDGMRSSLGCPGVATRVPSANGIRARSAWVPIVPSTNWACTHLDWKPAWQISQVLSEMTKDPTTKSPTFTVSTSAPTSSTMPTYSWPIAWCSTGAMPRYGHRSEPQMQLAASRMMASDGSMILGSSRSTTCTSPGSYMITPRTGLLLLLVGLVIAGCCAGRTGGLQPAYSSSLTWSS